MVRFEELSTTNLIVQYLTENWNTFVHHGGHHFSTVTATLQNITRDDAMTAVGNAAGPSVKILLSALILATVHFIVVRSAVESVCNSHSSLS